MSKPPTIDRKSLKTPDAFQREGLSVFDWILHHRRIWLPVIGGALAVAIGIYALEGYQQSQLNQGWLDYFNAMKKPETERSEALKGVANKWKKIRPGYFATVSLADITFNGARKELMKAEAKPTGEAVKAADLYTTALAFPDLLPGERQLLFLNRGQAKELDKKTDDAFADFKTASEFVGEAKPLALLAMARAEEARAAIPKAVEFYEKVASEFPNTEYARNAKLQVRRLKSPLFASEKNSAKKG